MKYLKPPTILEFVASGVGITALMLAGLHEQPRGTQVLCACLIGVAIGLGVISGKESKKP